MTTEIFEVTLHGGSPWGFRLQGGKEFRAPLLIAKVTPGSKAAKQGIIIGDWLININSEPCDDMTHSNALNCIKKTGNDLVLTLERRPFEDSGPYSTNSLPRGTRLTNGSSNNHTYKSVEGYATLPRKKTQNTDNEKNYSDYKNDVDVADTGGKIAHSSSPTHSSGVSSRYSEEDNDNGLNRGNVMSPTTDDWSPDLISDAVRTPQPIRLISKDDQNSRQTDTSRVKSPSTIHGFTDKPVPVGRGARRNNDEEIKDSPDNPMLNSGTGLSEEMRNDDDSGKHSTSPPSTPVFQSSSRPAISHLVKRREGVPIALRDASIDPFWHKYHYVDEDRIKRAAEQPYRRYSYHGSVLNDHDKQADGTERPRIQAGSGWYKELFKEMHTGAGTSSGLSSLLAGDASPPKNDARGLFKGYRSKSMQENAIRATKTQNTHAEPSSVVTRRTENHRNVDQAHRYSTSALPSSTAPVKMRLPESVLSERTRKNIKEKPTTRNQIPSWYRELQKGKDVSEEEIIEDRRHSKGYQVPGGVRSPGAVGPEYPVVRSYSLGTRSAAAPVVHREPPQRLHTQTYKDQNDNAPKPGMRYSAATRTAPKVEPEKKPSASNLYEDHLRNRQTSPDEPLKFEMPKAVDYVKKFEEEEERFREDERRAKEDLERKIREGNKAKEEAERRQLEIERRKKEELESRKHPKRARALYNFSPQSIKEIGFRKGDVITFFRTIDPNWSEGESQGNIGLFPTTYVEILEERVVNIEGEGTVKYNFKAESARELNLQKGDIVGIIRQIDVNWYEGRKDDRVGIFPVSYVDVTQAPSEERQEVSSQQVQEQVIKENGLPEVQSAPGDFHQESNHDEKPMVNSGAKGDINNLDGERYVVVFGYAPQNEDELQLSEGDLVKVVEKCDDGWFVGISERTGEFGTFPGNYVKQTS